MNYERIVKEYWEEVQEVIIKNLPCPHSWGRIEPETKKETNQILEEAEACLKKL